MIIELRCLNCNEILANVEAENIEDWKPPNAVLLCLECGNKTHYFTYKQILKELAKKIKDKKDYD